MNIKDFPEGSGGSDIPAMEPGTYSAVCTGVIDIGTQLSNWDGQEKEQNQLILQFDFPSETVKIDGQDMPRCLTMKLTKSMHEKAKLRLTLASWRGRDFTDEERRNFELENLIGVPATVTVVNKETKNKVVACIASVGKAMKGMAAPKDCRKVFFDLFDKSTYGAIEEMPKWMVGLINDSLEAKKRNLFFKKKEDKTGANDSQETLPEKNIIGTLGNSPADYDDDVPF